MKQAACNVNADGNHHYHFKQIVQAIYDFNPAKKNVLVVENARLVQACECGHKRVEEI